MGSMKWEVDDDEVVPDPHRPPLPYVPGCILTISRHNPPVPFGPPYLEVPPEPREPVPGKIVHNISHSEYCVRFGPMQTSPHPESLTQRPLKILRQIQCKDNNGCIVVLCQWDDSPGEAMVAKIFDPLYDVYRTDDGCVFSPAWKLDASYSREAAAYEFLEKKGHNGRMTPRYFGSWTFQQSLAATWEGGSGKSVQRDVRMILMEHIDGTSMKQLMKSGEAQSMPIAHRMRIMAQTLEHEVRCYSYGVDHRDVAPRNVMVSGLSEGIDKVRVRLIDLNFAVLALRPNSPRDYCPPYFWIQTERPISPVTRNWDLLNHYATRELFEWLPEEMRNQEAWGKWLLQQWPDGGEFAPASTEWGRDEGRSYSAAWDSMNDELQGQAGFLHGGSKKRAHYKTTVSEGYHWRE